MKKFFKLSFALLVGAVMCAACSGDDNDDLENLPDQYEAVVKPYEVESKSAIIICEYHPKKSVEYQLRIGDTSSDRYAEERFLKIRNLAPDHEYIIKTTIYDADKKAIGMSKMRFKTPKSSVPDDLVTASEPITFEETDMEE